MWKDSETELDFLDYGYLVKSITEIVHSDDLLPACIGLYGDWGSGKSSLIRMCKTQLEEKDKNIKCLIFNGWLFENYEDAKTAILGEILDTFKEEAKASEKIKIALNTLFKSIDKFKLAKSALKFGVDIFTTGGIGTLANFTVKNVVENISGKVQTTQLEEIESKIRDELDYKELRNDIKEFQEKFAELIDESKISKLVVFVDELDRCRPDTILDTLEAIKLFLFTGKTAFVLGADERHIAYAVKSKFQDIEGQEIDIGKEYLEKLIQYPIKIPRLNAKEVETYTGCLLLQNDIDNELFDKLITQFQQVQMEDFTEASLASVAENLGIDSTDALTISHQLSELLTTGLNGNPRQCKRFLNMMDLRIKQASYKNKKLNRKILVKIMMLEYFRNDIFKKMASMSHDDTLSKELSSIENNKKTDKSNLAEYLNDEWFKKWIQIEPKLSKENLDMYFYFARTSLEERLNLLSSTLSPMARKMLTGLLGDVETTINKALKDCETLPSSEVVLIINAMGSKLTSMETIEKINIETFIKLVQIKEEFWKMGMNIIKKFSVGQITPSVIPFICAFAKDTNQVEDINKLCGGKWSKSQYIAMIKKALE